MSDLDYHVARVLLLLDGMSPRGRWLDGLTKLAKLDFLLRYPSFLDRLLSARGLQWPDGLAPTTAERLAVESRMIRYKYGPWDHRYYPIIGFLLGTGLAEQSFNKGRQSFRLTAKGRAVAKRLARDPHWATVAGRVGVLREQFDLSGNALREQIYDELPEAMDRPLRSEI